MNLISKWMSEKWGGEVDDRIICIIQYEEQRKNFKK